MSIATPPPTKDDTQGGAEPSGRSSVRMRDRSSKRLTSLFAHGEPMVWLSGGSLVLALAMIVGLLVLVMRMGFGTFWPAPLHEIELADGRTLLGEITRAEPVPPKEGDGGVARMRREVRVGNFDISGVHFTWVDDDDIVSASKPEHAMLLERLEWGRFYGTPIGFEIDGRRVADGPVAAYEEFKRHHGEIRDRWERARSIEKHDLGAVNGELESDRLAVRRVGLDHGFDSERHAAAQADLDQRSQELDARYEELRAEVEALDGQNDGYQLLMETADGQVVPFDVDVIVRAVPANGLTTAQKWGVYASRWVEFLTDGPRESNTEGGVLPAIFGTVLMTMIMTLVVVPFGVLAALYLREYAKQGFIVSVVRIAVNNLAGVPSIVFGVFGLGFFCYMVGARIDELFYYERLPTAHFGTGGIMWAALTLSLLTLPVVIVATEEALSAVPNSMREGSYACGASKWQTIRRIVLPRAAPGIMTGVILAIARGAGEVAPLMIVGAVKFAPELPIDGVAPFVHLERSFMHLGFHIYDLGFQSQNSEAAKPMVFTTTLLLISIVVLLNVAAIGVRSRLNRRFGIGRI